MNIAKALEFEHSKQNTEHIVKYIGSDANKFDELMQLFFGEDTRIVQRSSWVLGKVGEEQPQLIHNYLPKMIALLDQPVHDAVKRNIVRIMQFIEIPEELHGIAIDKCFSLLMNRKESVAIRAFSITVLDNFCKQYPDLMGELISVLKSEMEYTTAAFKSRARKIIKREMC